MHAAPESIAKAVAHELNGERILWAGAPDPWAISGKYVALGLFSIPFALIAIFWTYFVAGRMPANESIVPYLFFVLWGLMFVAGGLSMMLSPLFIAWSARNIYYVVTEKRAVIFEKPFLLKIQSLRPTAIADFESIPHGDAKRSIIFKRFTINSTRGRRVKEIGFIGLKDFKAAEAALNKLVALSNKT